jgi:hypothetical protein
MGSVKGRVGHKGRKEEKKALTEFSTCDMSSGKQSEKLVLKT